MRRFPANEWEVIMKLRASFTDQEQKKAFMETVLEKLKLNPAYSVFMDFPEMRGEKSRTETAREACVGFVRTLRGG